MHTFEELRDRIEQKIAEQPYALRRPDGLFHPISYILSLGGQTYPTHSHMHSL